MSPKVAVLLTLLLVIGLFIFYNINQTPDTVKNNVKEEKAIYGAILTASAAILAITFTVSQYTIGQIAKDYSPYLVEYYYKIDKLGAFGGFVTTIILSAMGLSITNQLDLQVHQFYIELTILVFLASVLSYVKTFFEIINIINPLKFSKYIFQFVRDELKKESEKTENLIVSMGSTTRKFIDNKEGRIAMDFLDQFQNLAELYLVQKEQHDINKNVNKEFYDNLRKSPILHMVQQLQKIYKYAYEKEEFEITEKIIRVIEVILQKSMEYENNDDIVRLFTSKGYGYVLFDLLEITLSDKKERSEKLVLAYHLFRLPLTFLRSEKVIFRYLDYLSPEHIFYMVKKIIDENDFDFFTHFVRESTLTFSDFEPAEISSQILYDILEDRLHPHLTKSTYELEFIIQTECALNPKNISKFTEKLDSYKKILLEGNPDFPEMVETRVNELFRKSLRYYVSSLIYTATFWIGAYLVYKGKDYGRYLYKLWTIAIPEEDPTTYLNKPPIATNLNWSILRVLGEGSFTSTPQFGDFQSAEAFFYKYLGMVFLKADQLFSFPSPMDIKSLAEYGENDILSKWMGICNSLKKDIFLKNTENLNQKVDLAKFFKYDNVMAVLKNKIERMQHDAEECEKTIERLRPMERKLIDDVISLALTLYKKHSRIDSISVVNLTEEITLGFDEISPKFGLPRSVFQEISGVAQYLDPFFEGIALDFARYEIKTIFDRIDKIKKIAVEKTKLEDLHIVLEKLYNNMKSAGHEPDLIFIPYGLLSEFHKQTRSPYTNQISLGGKLLETVHHNNLKNEIILACKKSIKVSYIKTDQGRLAVTITEDPTNTQNATIVYFMASKSDILDSNEFYKIFVTGVERSVFYRKKQSKDKSNKKEISEQ